MIAASIACLKITLDDVKPAILRRIEVPLNIRLDRLHLAIQAAMGWSNSHLYEIRARDVGWGEPDPDGGDGPLDARKARLVDVLEGMSAQKRSDTSTTSATAGSTRSRSSALPMPYPALLIRAWSRL